ncbi:MAG: site-specific integrase [Alphaproteobacteria bacterium]|nr:site-specific integrase [Alphaproteobacteria bacterium]
MTARKTVRLTDAGIARLKPRRTEYIVWDRRVPGLGVRVRPSGHRGFVWHGQADGRAVRKTVGPAAIMSVEEARAACLVLRNGEGLPGTDDGRGSSDAPLFRDFATDEWKPNAGARWKPSRRKQVERILKTQLLPVFGKRRLDRIRRRDVERWFDAYSNTAPGGANLALQLLRQILNAAVDAGSIAANPTEGIRRNPRPKFTRFLSTDEIDRLHRTLDRLVEERPSRRWQADIVRLLLLTGCRKGEIQMLRWSEIDGDVLRLEETKTRPRTVWLSAAARAILDRQPRTGSRYVFPAPKNPARPSSRDIALWDRARKEANIQDVRLHDLRHTVASQAVARGVALSTVAKMLGHANPTMTLRYAHVGDRDVQAAAERIGSAIDAAMADGRTENGSRARSP